MILRGCENPRNLRRSEGDKKLGKIVWVFSSYDKKRWKWDDVYQPMGFLTIDTPSFSPPTSPLYLRTPTVAHKLCTAMPWSSKSWDALGDHDHANVEAIIERVWINTGRSWWNELGDALGGRNRVSSEMQLEAIIVQTRTVIGEHRRCTWKPW